MTSHIPLGFSTTPASREHEPGHPSMDIWLAETPTQAHFDPEQVSLYVFAEDEIAALEIGHPWTGETSHRLAAGTVTMIDRKNKHIAGFLFGGEMNIEVLPDCTHVHLTSNAPIMLHSTERPEISLLIEEASILLARRRAFWVEQPHELAQRLSSQDPLTLYGAFLLSIQNNFDQLPPSDDEIYLKARHIVHQELDDISLLLPGFELPLETIC